jgi:AAA15 family ATPase/GTPase
MFKHIELKNYKTHKLTKLDIQDVTLLIGNNNSGKSNLLSGIRFFSSLIRRAKPSEDHAKDDQMVVDEREFRSNIYKFAGLDEVMSISLSWEKPVGNIIYNMELYRDYYNFGNEIGCREDITVNIQEEPEKRFEHGYDKPSNKLALRENIDATSELTGRQKSLCRIFFDDFDCIYAYHLQPSFIKQSSPSIKTEDETVEYDISELKEQKLFEKHLLGERSTQIPSLLGYEGGNFQDLIRQIKERNDPIFQKIIFSLRRIQPSFHGIYYNKEQNQLYWQFDVKGNLQDFPTEAVSDGLIKAAVISLLTSLQPYGPSFILLEEIENGINPGNIQEFMRLIWQATNNKDMYTGTQFILTSHSPSVLREFNDLLDHVYIVRLNANTLVSDVTNLSDALDMLMRIGSMHDDVLTEREGEKLIKIPKHELTELWYSGTIG